MSRTPLPYELWDVFTTEPFSGNPLAVIPDASRLTDAQMQRIANEFNLSETSFVLPPATADVRARYFTPARELPMAGHPSVGTVYALDAKGMFRGKSEVTLELAVGPVTMALERDGESLSRVWMDQGVPRLLETFDRAAVAAALGLQEGELEPTLPVQLGSAGIPFLLVPVVSLEALAKVNVSASNLTKLLRGDHQAVFAFTRNAPESGATVPDIRARMLGAAMGISEDPATGGAHGPLGAYLAAYTDILTGDKAEFISHQGVEMNRKSELFVKLSRTAAGVRVSVGGSAVQIGEGTLFL